MKPSEECGLADRASHRQHGHPQSPSLKQRLRRARRCSARCHHVIDQKHTLVRDFPGIRALESPPHVVQSLSIRQPDLRKGWPGPDQGVFLEREGNLPCQGARQKLRLVIPAVAPACGVQRDRRQNIEFLPAPGVIEGVGQQRRQKPSQVAPARKFHALNQ